MEWKALFLAQSNCALYLEWILNGGLSVIRNGVVWCGRPLLMSRLGTGGLTSGYRTLLRPSLGRLGETRPLSIGVCHRGTRRG